MSRVCIVALFLCVVFASGYVHGNLIRSNEAVVQAVDEKEVQGAVIDKFVNDVPEEVAPKCKKIGEFVSILIHLF